MDLARFFRRFAELSGLPFSPVSIVSSPFSYPQRVDEFISLSSNQSSGSPDVQHLAFCFLAARKFSVAQALELYHNYQIMLSREGVSQRIDPFDEDVRQELLSGKFVILNDHEVSGARVAQFFVRLHRTNNNNNRSLLQSILFQLDAVLKKEAASRSGLVFIYDMTDAKFANIDCSNSLIRVGIQQLVRQLTFRLPPKCTIECNRIHRLLWILKQNIAHYRNTARIEKMEEK
ncbi:hypothetical protein AHF37_03091 [Paragonimus kellicotti]|nr:hypothetical protein AHF37_03091 [Paragonimus kellicotti]